MVQQEDFFSGATATTPVTNVLSVVVVVVVPVVPAAPEPAVEAAALEPVAAAPLPLAGALDF